MRPLFNQGVTIREVPLDEDAPAILAGPVTVEAATHRAPLLDVTVRRDGLGEIPVTSRLAEWPAIVPVSQSHGQPLTLPVSLNMLAPKPFAARKQAFDRLGFATRVHAAPAWPRLRVHRDLDAIRDREVLKRAVLPRYMTVDQRAYWQKRMGDAKRVPARYVELVGVFPNVAIAGDAPVHYRAEEAAISYKLPESPVPLTTVVIARHQRTGELLLGRFHRV